MKAFLSPRMKQIAPSALVALNDRGKALIQSGADVLNFSSGDPDFITPQPIRDAMTRSLNSGNTHYVNALGTPALRQRIAEKLLRENGIDVDWKSQLIVTPGAKFALYLAITALIGAGDEVLYFEPGWVSYPQLVRLAGGTPVPVVLDREQNFAITKELLEQHVSERSKLVILCSPCNPTGRVMTAQEAETLTDFVLSHNLLLMTDEVYEKLIYDGRKHISLGADPRLCDRVITINGLSKSHAMTGWRVGYAAARPELISAMLKISQNTVTCIPGFIQDAAAEAFDYVQETEAMVREYDVRRKMLAEELSRIPCCTCALPEGAFYAFPHFDVPGMTSMQISEQLLENVGVLLPPGDAFGGGGDRCLRFCYAFSREHLLEGAHRMQKFFASL